MTKTPLISVILLDLDTPQMTHKSIKSLLEKTRGISFEIILVENGLKDSTKRYFDKNLNKIPDLKIVYSGSNLGYGPGYNLGVEHSCGKYILILSNDTLFLENSLKKLVNEYRKLSESMPLALLQPRLYLNQKKVLQRTCSKIPNAFQILQENLKFLKFFKKTEFADFKYLGWDRNSSKTVECVCAAVFMVERKIWQKIGGFDLRFKVYFEEYDLGRRIRKLKLKNYYTTKTSIIHFHDKTPVPWVIKKWIYAQSMIKYFLKYG